jgi:hypothetical protein
MKRIYITLGERVVSEGDSPEDKGSLVVLDWDNKQIIHRLSIRGRYSVEKGRSRGASGLDFFEGFLYVATRTDLIAFDVDTFKEHHRVNLLLQGVHQIKSQTDTLWLTTIKRNVKMAVRNQKLIDIVPTIYSGIENNQSPLGCFNSISFSPNGDEYHMYAGPKQIYNFTKKKVMIQDDVHSGPHDLCFLNEEELLFSRSINKEIVKANLWTGEIETIYSFPHRPSDPRDEFNFIGFTRGIEYDKNTNSIFFMTNPATIYEIDRGTWAIKDSLDFMDYDLSKEEIRRRCPFDLVLDPRDW